MAGKLRDLFSGTPPVEPTLRELASSDDRLPDSKLCDEVELVLSARLPGDERHPFQRDNIYAGQNPLAVKRMLDAGEITDKALRIQATDWLRMCARHGA